MQQDSSNQVQHPVVESTDPSKSRQRDGGYLLLAILLMMALMIIAATIAAPRVVQQIKRDREEEMIHRGTQYARAIKKYYKKFGSYPSTLEQLDTTNQIRFLRRRYKDPLTKDGKWKLLNYGDIATLLNAAAPGTSAAALASQNGLSPGGALTTSGSASGGLFSSSQQQQQQQGNSFGNGFSASSSQGNQDPNIIYPQNSNNQGVGLQAGQANSGQSESGSQQSGSLLGQNGAAGGSPNGSTSSTGNSPFAQNTTGGTQTFGGGAIVGVASLSKDPTIRLYNKKKTYNEWMFIYNPMMDVQNVLLRGPYQPVTIGGSQIGTPASQINGQQQGAFGQQQNGFGQQQSGFGQQQNGFGQQQNTPQPPGGGNFPQQQNQQQ